MGLRRALVRALFFAAPALSGCAVLHHAQVGDVDARGKLKPFDVKVSEIGVSVDEAIAVAKSFSGKNDQKNLGTIGDVIAMFQMGPHTGKGVFNDTYAEGLVEALHKECPSGKVTGLVAVRETREYPVISGEIVKITAYCKG